MSILQSPFLTLPILNTLLNDEKISKTQRLQLLSAKLHLLINSLPPRRVGKSEKRDLVDRNKIEILELRLEIGKSYLGIGDDKLAEVEFGLIEREVGGVERALKRFLEVGNSDVDGVIGERELINPPEGVCPNLNDSTELDGVLSEIAGSGSQEDGGEWLIRAREIRLEALRLMITVEEGLGRLGRAERWRTLIKNLEGG